MSTTTTITTTIDSIVVMGGHSWGSGTDLAEAKKKFRSHGGRLSDGYTTFVFPPELTFQSVDQMGYVGWTGADSGVEPIVSTTTPKTRKA